MSLSVIISTSPQRENNLALVLKMLQKQSFQDFEVVIVDDGSRGGRDVAEAFSARFSLTYHWRPNDCCPSRSRNLGARLAAAPKWVFIDTDILLNPDALFYYNQYLRASQAIVYGYYSIYKAFESPSRWFPQQRVNWLDNRFVLDNTVQTLEIDNLHEFRPIPIGGSQLWIHRRVFELPQVCTWSGNFAVRKYVYEAISGFDEEFVGWGYEDVDFGNRAMQAGFPLHFSLETWGEHLAHGTRDRFHASKVNVGPRKQRAEQQGYAPLTSPVVVYRSEPALQVLSDAIASYLLQVSLIKDPA